MTPNFWFLAKIYDSKDWQLVNKLEWRDNVLQWIYLDKKMVRAEKVTLKIATQNDNE